MTCRKTTYRRGRGVEPTDSPEEPHFFGNGPLALSFPAALQDSLKLPGGLSGFRRVWGALGKLRFEVASANNIKISRSPYSALRIFAV